VASTGRGSSKGRAGVGEDAGDEDWEAREDDDELDDDSKSRIGALGHADRVGKDSNGISCDSGNDDTVGEDESGEEDLEIDEDSDIDERGISGEGGKGMSRGSMASITGDSGSLGEGSENDTVLDANPKDRKDEKGGMNS